jgi:DNA invertase Pin-like site-specific DNA recombinase
MVLKCLFNVNGGRKMTVLLKTQSTNKVEQTSLVSPPKRTVRIIEPRKQFMPNAQRKDIILRVAAYCRVSTDSDEQELSFNTQCSFYQNMIMEKENYQLAGIYADEGITGTSTLKRKDFLRMMDDCKAGKIDMIITKSCTRFARNTLDAIYWIRKLKEWKINVFFETENINTLEASELLISMLSSMAQESSNEKSHWVKWGYRRQFERGKVYIRNLYGYQTVDKEIQIVEKEANVVREVFKKYVEGSSEDAIKNYLNGQGIQTRGNKKFSSSMIHRMLQNEKYAGDAIAGKTYNIDFLHPKRLKNNGQEPMYFIENSHDGIISKETFKQAQIERARRTSKFKIEEYNERYQNSKPGKIPKKNAKGRYSSVNALANRIICSECGNFYRRVVWTKRSGERQPVWRCNTKLDMGKNGCPNSITLKESKLFDELRFIINEMLLSKENVRMKIAEKVSEYVNPKDILECIKKLENSINELDEEISKILKNGTLLVSRGVQDENQIKEHLEQQYKKKKALMKSLNENSQRLQEVRRIKQEKIAKVLKQIDISSVELTQDELTQDEIAIFINEIVVYKDKLLIKTVVDTTVEIEISNIK